MKNDREVYFQSERTGYSHLYAVAFDGGEPRALTSGKWEVLNVRQSRDKSRFYLTANKESPYEQHLYEMPGEGGPLTRLTAAPGKHAATVSPDERWIADVYSYTNKPPELYVQENRPQAESKKITTSPAAGVLAVSLAGCADREVHGARRRQGAGAAVQAGGRAARRSGRGLRARRRDICRTWTTSGRLTITSTCSTTS